MPLRSSIICFLAGGLLLGSAGRAGAELAASSPFLPPPGQAAALAPTALTPLEFRGMSAVNGSAMFSIFDPSPSKKSGHWVKLNESGHDFVVKKYDPDSETVTVDYQGRTLTLTMRTPTIASTGVAVAPSTAAFSRAPGNFGPAPIVMTQNAASSSSMPVTDVLKLAEMSSEIKRRREMRSQATAQAAGPQLQAAPQSAEPPVQRNQSPNQAVGPQVQR